MATLPASWLRTSHIKTGVYISPTALLRIFPGMAISEGTIHSSCAEKRYSVSRIQPLTRTDPGVDTDRNASVPKSAGSNPMLTAHSRRTRAYCRVVRLARSPRPAKRDAPGFRLAGLKSSSAGKSLDPLSSRSGSHHRRGQRRRDSREVQRALKQSLA